MQPCGGLMAMVVSRVAARRRFIDRAKNYPSKNKSPEKMRKGKVANLAITVDQYLRRGRKREFRIHAFKNKNQIPKGFILYDNFSSRLHLSIFNSCSRGTSTILELAGFMNFYYFLDAAIYTSALIFK